MTKKLAKNTTPASSEWIRHVRIPFEQTSRVECSPKLPQLKSRQQVVAVIPASSGLEPPSPLLTSTTRSNNGLPHVHVDDAVLSIRDQKVTNGVEFPPILYRVLWLGVLALHALIAASYAEECVIYVRTLDNPKMNSYLQHFGIGDHQRVDVSMAMITTSTTISAWYTVAYLRALVCSL